MPYRKITKELTIAYASAVIIISILIVTSQILIQLTLARGIETRALASTMALQELRTQAIFRNALLAILPDGEQQTMNALNVDPIAALTKNLADVEATNAILVKTTMPVDISSQMQALQSDFLQMDKAGHLVLNDLKSGNSKAASDQVGILFMHEQKYLVGTYNAYNALTSDADAYVVQIRALEAFIAIASLIVLAVEALAIVRPAIADYRKALDTLEQMQKEPQT